jgi:REP element-mobilizing transposase RayT
LDGPTIVFCTVCTRDGDNWCATQEVKDLLHDIWLHQATAWQVGAYVLMPDHIHFFAAPSSIAGPSIERWSDYWKGRFAKRCGRLDWRWQRALFHHRLRSPQEWLEKSAYVRNNPVVKELAASADEWPWQGTVHTLQW